MARPTRPSGQSDSETTNPGFELPDPDATPPAAPTPAAVSERVPAPAPRPGSRPPAGVTAAPVDPSLLATLPGGQRLTGSTPPLGSGAVPRAQIRPAATGSAPALNKALFDSKGRADPLATGSRPAAVRTGATPALKPTSGSHPAAGPFDTGTRRAAPRGATGAVPVLNPLSSSHGPALEETIVPAANAEELQREIRARTMSGTSGGRPAAVVRPPPEVKPSTKLNTKPVVGTRVDDTFVRQKMKEAETNLPDFDEDLLDDLVDLDD